MSGFLRGAPDVVRRLALSRDRAVDLAVATTATALNVAGAIQSDPTLAYDVTSGHPVLVAVSSVAGLALLLRRSHPLEVFVAVTGITAAITAGYWQTGFLPVTLLLAAYALGAFASTRASAAGLAVAAGCFALLFAMSAPYFDSPIGLAVFGQIALAWVLGAAVARRRADAVRAMERSARLAREGARETERAVHAERLRVARELNDAVADAMTAITLQAAAGRRHGDRDGVLVGIERTGRGASEDLRRLLRALREPDPPPVEGTAEGPVEGTEAVLGTTGPRTAIGPVDLALAGCVVLFNVTGSVLPDPSTTIDYRDPVLPALILLASVPGLALIVRRRYPVAVLAAVLGAVGVVTALGWQTGNLPGSVLIATYAVGAWAPVGRGVAALAMMAAALCAVAVADIPDFEGGSVVGALLIFTAPWVAGVVIRRRRLADQARVALALAAEREHAAATERALAEERLAVARDLHDLVSHNLAAITVQSAAARRRGDPGGSTLHVIEETGRAALADLRQMLDALRRPGGEPDPPAPGLPEIEDLVAQHRVRHGPVELVIDPALEQEPGSLRTTAFRVVQESLTNVARHAPGAPAVVTLTASDRGIRVEVENRPRAPGSASAPGSGWGLAGMGERVALVGGTLEAAETADGGFAVHAELDRRVGR